MSLFFWPDPNVACCEKAKETLWLFVTFLKGGFRTTPVFHSPAVGARRELFSPSPPSPCTAMLLQLWVRQFKGTHGCHLPYGLLQSSFLHQLSLSVSLSIYLPFLHCLIFLNWWFALKKKSLSSLSDILYSPGSWIDIFLRTLRQTSLCSIHHIFLTALKMLEASMFTLEHVFRLEILYSSDT